LCLLVAFVGSSVSMDPCSNITASCGKCVDSTTDGTRHADSCLWCSKLNSCHSPNQKPMSGCDEDECVKSPDGGENANCSKVAGMDKGACPGYVPPPPPGPTPPGIWNPNCTCKDYCDYKCSNNETSQKDLHLYRVTPYITIGVKNLNTADPSSDVAFVLERKQLAMECATDPTQERCFLAHQNIYARYTVAFDGKWGPYQFCNPTTGSDGQPNVSAFSCCASFNHDNPGICIGPPTVESYSPYEKACSCARGNVSVGRVDHGLMSKHWTNGSDYETVLGGNWYSTPAPGECKGDEMPGSGKPGECTWKVSKSEYKNTTCVDAALDGNIEKRNPKCFNACPGPKGSIVWNSCYYECYTDTLNGVNGTKPMTKNEITEPWLKAMTSTNKTEGGCPYCIGEPPFQLGSCP